MPHLLWQVSLLPGYIIGAVVSSLLTFLIFKKWRAKKAIRIVVAVIILVVTVYSSYIVITERSETLMTRANQSIRDQ